MTMNIGRGLALFIAAPGLEGAASAQHGYTRAEIENGARLYQANCATCHGAGGDTVRDVNLLSGKFRRPPQTRSW